MNAIYCWIFGKENNMSSHDVLKIYFPEFIVCEIERLTKTQKDIKEEAMHNKLNECTEQYGKNETPDLTETFKLIMKTTKVIMEEKTRLIHEASKSLL